MRVQRQNMSIIAFFRRVLFCLILVSSASAETCDVILKKYSSRHVLKAKDPKCYSPGSCHLNILRLYKSIAQELGYRDEDIRVLILYRPSFDNGLIPVKANSTKMFKDGNRGWGFHVVLEYQGKVYDFDYQHKREDIPNLRDYFVSMFSPPSLPKKKYLRTKFGINSKEIHESFESMEVIDLPASYLLETYGKKISLGRANIDYFLYGGFSNEIVYSESVLNYVKRKEQELDLEW